MHTGLEGKVDPRARLGPVVAGQWAPAVDERLGRNTTPRGL